MKHRRKIGFKAGIQEMASEVVISHIGADRLAAIRSKDEHPMFLGLKVAEEGISKGEVVGMGDKEKNWPEWAVAQLGWAFNGFQDIGLFDAHQGREKERNRVGDVVSGYHNGGIEDKPVEAFAIAYMEPGDPRQKVRDQVWDTASIEGEVVLIEAPDGTLTVDMVLDVTGIALGNASINAPGFPGAGIVAVVQELQEEKEDQEMAETEKTLIDLIKESSPDQIRAALATRAELAPSQMFTQAQLQADNGVVQIHSKLQADLDQKTQELTGVTTERDQLKKEKGQASVGDQVSAQVRKLNGLTDPERAHIQSQVAQLDFSAEENTEEAVGKAIELQVEAVNKLREGYGQKAVVVNAPAEKDEREEAEGEEELKVDKSDPFLTANHATTEGELVPAS